MFSKNKKTISNNIMARNIIAKGTTFVGDIKSDGDFRIDGTLEGSLKTSGRVIIGKEGFIKGKVEATNADIEGKFSGELHVSNILTLKETANVSGDIFPAKLNSEPGATLNANCSMKGSVKELNHKNAKTKQAEKTA